MEKMKTFLKEFFEDFTTKKKLIVAGVAVAAVALIVGLVILIVNLVGGNNPAGTYTVEVVTEGGKALEEVGVYVYTDDSLEDLTAVGRTDGEGKFSFESEGAVGQVITLRDVPRGYVVSDTYKIKKQDTTITLEIELLSEENIEDLTFGLGDVFVDMSVTDTEGTTYKISDLLKEKKAVVLNFWYINCGPCKSEFPFLEEAYNEYKDSLEVLAIDVVDVEDEEGVAAYKAENGLTFPMAVGNPAYEAAMKIEGYPTTVVIDRYGTIGYIHSGTVTEVETFTTLFAYFTADEYKQTTVKNISDIMASEEENPSDVEGLSEMDVTVGANGVEYVEAYKVNGMLLSIEDPDAYVVYNDKTYEPENGVVSLIVDSGDTFTPVKFGVGNKSDAEKTFKVKFSFIPGTAGAPFELGLGDVTVSVEAGNSQGVYYTYVAEMTGTITIQCKSATAGVEYDYTLYNLESYVFKTLAEDGVADDNGNVTLSVDAHKGDEIQFIVSTLPNEENEYPAGEFTFNVSMVEGEIEGGNTDDGYVITIVGEDGEGISGVTVNIMKGTEVAATVTTDENGIAKADLEEGKYTVTIVTPSGYKTDSTEYELSETKTTLNITLYEKTATTKTYTVKVVDEKGNAISNALVSVGDQYGRTNNSGTISFTLAEDNYTAIASADGYTSNSADFNGKTSITITLKKGQNSGETYSVTVVDYAGNPLKGVTVQFLQNGTPISVVEVNSNGVATAKLPSGTYTISLAGNYYCDKSNVTLTSSKKSITVLGAIKASEYEDCYFDSTTYVLNVGGTYVELKANKENYFIFTPAASGTYKITTTTPSAVVSSWNGSTSFLGGKDQSGQEIILNVKESMLGNSYILSATGVSECIFIIERTGSAVLDVNDYPWTVFSGTHTPTAKTTPTGTKVDFNVEESTYNVVLGSDGYYHLNSTSGPIVYVQLKGHKEIDFKEMLGSADDDESGVTSFRKVFYDANGNFVKKEEYTDLMRKYIACADTTYGVYPLTEDLKYMLQQGGDAQGWYTYDGAGYLFDAQVSTEQAWMFACCYFQ